MHSFFVYEVGDVRVQPVRTHSFPARLSSDLDDVGHAAALDAGRGVFIDETDRDVDVDDRMLADAQEIRVKRAIAHRVELHVLGQGADDMILVIVGGQGSSAIRSEEHTSELQSLMRISYAVFCLKKKKKIQTIQRIIKSNNNNIISIKYKNTMTKNT